MSSDPAAPPLAPGSECPVFRSLTEVGERWTLLILRDAFTGLTRFEDFRRSLGCPTNILSVRLAGLVERGLLERRRYWERPPRDEYVLTGKGRDLFPVMAALVDWGNRWLAPEGPALLLAETGTGERVETALVHAGSGRRIEAAAVALTPGPAAGPQMRALLAKAPLPTP